MRLLLIFVPLLCLLLPCGCAAPMAAEGYLVGFRTLGQWQPERKLRLDVNVWYPTIRQPRELNYAPWEFSAARGGKAVEGRFPLLLLSHDTAGTRFSYHDTAAALAALGFVVAAPNHPTDNMDNMDSLLTWDQLENRARELSGTIDLLLATPETAASIDATRVGLVGFGSGGTAALLLGGALPDCENWPAYCGNGSMNDMYCHAWSRQRLDALCRRLPLRKSLADPRVLAVAAISPTFGMLFSSRSFRWFYPPLLLMAAGEDQLHDPARHARHIYDLMGGKPRWVLLPEADIGALMAPCSDALADQLPDLCRSVTPAVRARVHALMHETLSDFFLQHLGDGAARPSIPPPPDLTPPPPPPPPPPPASPRAPRARRR